MHNQTEVGRWKGENIDRKTQTDSQLDRYIVKYIVSYTDIQLDRQTDSQLVSSASILEDKKLQKVDG